MEKPIIVFDLHGVVFKIKLSKLLKQLLKCPKKLKLFINCFNPLLVYRFLKLLLKKTPMEETLVRLIKMHPHMKEYEESGLDILSTQSPIYPTVEIIKRLSRGHPLYIFTNNGERVVERMKKEYPEIFGYFSGCKSCSASEDFLSKPNPEAFKNYLRIFNQKPEDIILIDNSPRNIEAAKKLGIKGILFTNQTTLKQLKI